MWNAPGIFCHYREYSFKEFQKLDFWCLLLDCWWKKPINCKKREHYFIALNVPPSVSLIHLLVRHQFQRKTQIWKIVNFSESWVFPVSHRPVVLYCSLVYVKIIYITLQKLKKSFFITFRPHKLSEFPMMDVQQPV